MAGGGGQRAGAIENGKWQMANGKWQIKKSQYSQWSQWRVCFLRGGVRKLEGMERDQSK
jgi:hypothetical protein